MSIFQESGIEFDFSQAITLIKYDEENRVFPSIDFLITDLQGQLWIEIKSGRLSRFPARFRGGQRRAFLAKMKQRKDQPFARELREKFMGTCTYLALTGNPPASSICYIMLLESMPTDKALRIHMMDRMQKLLRTNTRKPPWIYPVSVVVLDVAEWNARLPEYPARLV
jgi:hypothetical protein